MKFNFDKILAGLGNLRAMERTHIDTHTENRINKIKGIKIGESEFGHLYIESQELGGFEFLNVSIISATDIKSNKGCRMIFTGTKNDLILQSDNEKIESDYSNVSKRWLTKMSFEITKGNMNRIDNKEFNNILIPFKKKTIPFKIIK